MEFLNYSPENAKIVTKRTRSVDLGRQGENLVQRVVFKLPDGIDNPVSAKICYVPSGHDAINIAGKVYSNAVEWMVTSDITRYAVRGELNLIIRCADGSIFIPYALHTVVHYSMTGTN